MVPPVPPARSDEQRRAAAAQAVRARAVRAAWRQDLASGAVGLADVFAALDVGDETGAALGAMRVLTLLQAMPGVGERRADRATTTLRIPPGRRARGLGPAQRTALLARFGGRVPPPATTPPAAPGAATTTFPGCPRPPG